MRLHTIIFAVLLSATAAAQDLDEGFHVPHRTTAPPLASVRSLPPERDLLSLAVAGPSGRWQVAGEPLTIDVALQQQLTELLKTYQTPWAAVVTIEPATGRVLAMAEHAEVDPGLRGLCTKAVYPAASIFKIVTAQALLEAEVDPTETTCFHGGKRHVTENLLDDSPDDANCATVAEALGRSANVVFAKLTAKYLDPDRLARAAKAFHFNGPLPFAIPAEVSLAAIPDETLQLASTGAGFGDVYLSPLHGAALMAALANGGHWRWPVLFEKDVGARAAEPMVSGERAQTLVDMLETTVTSGTARRIFSERGHQFEAVGKTGSLADKGPVFRDYSWFVGFAPKLHPAIAVAAVVVNDPAWRIRGTWLGAEAMRLFLEKRLRGAPPDAGVTPTRSTSGRRNDQSK